MQNSIVLLPQFSFPIDLFASRCMFGKVTRCNTGNCELREENRMKNKPTEHMYGNETINHGFLSSKVRAHDVFFRQVRLTFAPLNNQRARIKLSHRRHLEI